jgi:hypothetical protein
MKIIAHNTLVAGEAAQIIKTAESQYMAIYMSNAGPSYLTIDTNFETVQDYFYQWIERYFDTVHDNGHR